MSPIVGLVAQSETRIFYQCQPLVSLHLWWHVLILIACVLASLVFVAVMYRRETRELPRGIAFLLTFLRALVFLVILVFILNPERRSETLITKDSRLAVLFDTSLSMGLRDEGPEGTERRIDLVVQAFENDELLKAMANDHAVALYRFGDQARPEPIGSFDKINHVKANRSLTPTTSEERTGRAQMMAWTGIVIVVIGFAFVAGWFGFVWSPQRKQLAAWLLAIGYAYFIVAIGFFAAADMVDRRTHLLAAIGWSELDSNSTSIASETTEPEIVSPEDKVDWQSVLEPNGTSTKLSDAIQYIVNKERGGPIAGVVVVTDGRNNSTVPTMRAIAAATNAGIPIFPVGVGGTANPKNVVVADVQIPPRAFPDDKFQVNALVQGYGLAGTTIRVELLSTDANGEEPETLEDEQSVRLLEDGKAAKLQFEMSRTEQGKRRFIVRAERVEGDLLPRDNQRSAVIEIIEKRTVVLMMAGGPTREFRFLRNQLYRDDEIELHVLLQTAKVGADQESDELLTEFPSTRDQLYRYDCIIGFDPDWRRLSEQKAKLLEKWVSEKAGGLLLIAGPVNTPEWTRRARGDQVIDSLRRLYPVSFYSQGTATLKLGRFGGEHAYPLEFSREGRAAEYLWLGDTATDSSQQWARFDGVFGYYAVNEPKRGADVLARFSDPQTSVSGELPIYLASHFYGAGRVFFQASGEMWRVRRLNVNFFEQYYLKIIRWVSQGRLMRESTRGVLLADRSRVWMGGQVAIEAILRDAQDEPLMVPSVDALLRKPDGTTETMTLRGTQNSVRPGTYTAQFSASLEGDYQINLPIPNAQDNQVLTVEVQANIPDLEKQQPQRNDSLLNDLADKTNGHYFVGMESLENPADASLSMSHLIPPQDQQTFLPGTPDRIFTRKLMIWILFMLTFSLVSEWVLRRLHKLA